MGDFVKASNLYKDLAGTQAAIENEENDLRINSGATDAQLEWKRQGDLVLKKKPGREDLEAFETAYNAACGSIARGELGQGEVLLKRAKGGFFPHNVRPVAYFCSQIYAILWMNCQMRTKLRNSYQLVCNSYTC